MKTGLLFTIVALVWGNVVCYGQIPNERMGEPRDNEPILLETEGYQIVFQSEDDVIVFMNQECSLGCRFLSFLEISEFDNTPRRDFGESICRSGGIIERPDGTLSFHGSRNAPLAFIDGVKIRGSYALPAHAVLSVDILSRGIPANIGDTDSGGLLFVTRSVWY